MQLIFPMQSWNYSGIGFYMIFIFAAFFNIVLSDWAIYIIILWKPLSFLAPNVFYGTSIAVMAELFNKSRSTFNEHILNFYNEEELREVNTMRKIGNSDFFTKPTNHYISTWLFLLVIVLKSIQGTRFRQGATQRLKEYMVKGFARDDERLNNLGGGNYWKELLDRIRDYRI